MTWLLETVATQAGGDKTTINIDSLGNPWILYSTTLNPYQLILAHWNGASWIFQHVTEGSGFCLSFVLDSMDRPHVVYDIDPGLSKDMHYAFWNGAAWVYETIDSQGDLGSTCSIALDTLDRPHVSYEDYTWNAFAQKRDLKYGWRDASGWHNETVDSVGYVGLANSIAVDSSNRPHISYTDFDNYTLKYAWWDGLSWNISTVDRAGGISWANPTSIRLDTFGRPHIAYYAGVWSGPMEIRHASWNGASWVFEAAAGMRDFSGFDSLSLRLDSSDRPSIAYTNHTYGLSYTSKRGGSWTVENIDMGGASVMGNGASLALDSAGTPHVSYVDEAYYVLKYARRGMDAVPPSSSVDRITPYWASSPRTITATATDGQSRVSNVTLWYRFSPDNASATWGPWTRHGVDDAPPWSWLFDFPAGEGYYGFASVANDTGGNAEPPPAGPEAIAAVDRTPPGSAVQGVAGYWFRAAPLSLTAAATDALSGVASVDLYYLYSWDNASWDPPMRYGTDPAPPWSWAFPFPMGPGWYRLYSRAGDIAGNVEDPPPSADVELGFDDYEPLSTVEPIAGGWHRFPLAVTASAQDAQSGVASVDLWDRFSPDGVAWSPWVLFGSDASPPWSWAFTSPDGDGHYEFRSIATDRMGNVEPPKSWSEANATVDAAPPSASVDPSPRYWKTSAAVVTAAASDRTSGVANATLWYRSSPDNTTWTSWTAFATDASPPWSWLFGFPDGPGRYQFQATACDNAGNEEPVAPVPEAATGFDPDAPSASLEAGPPSASDPPVTWVTSATPLRVAAYDANGSGVASIKVRVWRGGWSPWSDYAGSLTLTGTDGLRYVEFQAFDVAGNAGLVENRTLILDETAPVTDIAPGTGPYTTETRFALVATDPGCGVDRTEYRIDGGPWVPYGSPFTVPAGDHLIGYRSIDRLNNTEAERTLPVAITSTTGLPGDRNSKPFVALVFSLVLLVAGAWASRRAPWRGGKGRRATLTAFALTALPFVALEAATGVVSLYTALLSVPPVLGVGTTVDAGILVAGLAVAGYRARGARRPRPEAS